MRELDQRNEELDQKIQETDLPSAVGVLIKDAKKRQRQLLILTVSLILDILLTVGLAAVSFKTQQIADQADNNQDAIIANCETANESRANNRQLWDYIINLPPQEPRTPEQEKRVVDFKAFVDKTFAPRDCDALKSS